MQTLVYYLRGKEIILLSSLILLSLNLYMMKRFGTAFETFTENGIER